MHPTAMSHVTAALCDHLGCNIEEAHSYYQKNFIGSYESIDSYSESEEFDHYLDKNCHHWTAHLNLESFLDDLFIDDLFYIESGNQIHIFYNA